MALTAPARTAFPDGGADQPKSIDDLYDRMAQDLSEGRPMVATVHVALCDNDAQGIVPVKNPKICLGHKPESNLYWATGGGLKSVLASEGWKKLSYDAWPNETLAVRAVWQKRFKPGKGLKARGVNEDFDIIVVGLAYRGDEIGRAMADFLKSASRDKEKVLTAGGVEIRYGGAGHVTGYIGHNYFLDIGDDDAFVKKTKGGSTLHKGVFALSCFGRDLIQPAVERSNTHVLVMNRSTTYPGAWTVAGILKGLAAGKNAKGIHYQAAKAFATGKKKPLSSILGAFTYGD